MSGPSFGRSSAPASKRRPSERNSSTSARFCSSANHSAISSARSGPIPGISMISSGVASRSRSTEPKCTARLRAITQPTFGMLSPNRTRRNGCSFERWIDSIAALAEISP